MQRTQDRDGASAKLSDIESKGLQPGRSRFMRAFLAVAPSLLFLVALELVCQWWEKRDPPAVALPQVALDFTAKEPGEVRLLLYGGSTVAGQPLPELSFHQQMKYLLRRGVGPEDNTHFTLANFGMVGASSTYVIYRMAQTLEESEGDVLVVFTAHNEFLSNVELVREEYAQLLAIREQFYRFAFMRRAQRYINRYYIARRPEFVEGRDLQAFARDSQRFNDRIELYRRNIETIVAMAQAADMPLLLCTAPSNTLDWSPARDSGGFTPRDSLYAQTLNQLRERLGNGEAEKAREQSLQLLRERPRDPLAMYYLGKAHYALGEFSEARRWLERAKEFDPFPFRALGVLNDIVREQANESGVFVVDLDLAFKEAAPHSLPGVGLFADNCHPSPEGNFLIAQMLTKALASIDLVEFGDASGAVEIGEILRYINFVDSNPTLQVQYFLANARYAMKPPFFQFEQAKWNLEKALRLDENNWAIWANLATVSFFSDDFVRGKEQLAHAFRLRGQRFDLDDRAAHPLLREALVRAGLHVQ